MGHNVKVVCGRLRPHPPHNQKPCFLLALFRWLLVALVAKAVLGAAPLYGAQRESCVRKASAASAAQPEAVFLLALSKCLLVAVIATTFSTSKLRCGTIA